MNIADNTRNMSTATLRRNMSRYADGGRASELLFFFLNCFPFFLFHFLISFLLLVFFWLKPFWLKPSVLIFGSVVVSFEQLLVFLW